MNPTLIINQKNYKADLSFSLDFEEEDLELYIHLSNPSNDDEEILLEFREPYKIQSYIGHWINISELNLNNLDNEVDVKFETTSWCPAFTKELTFRFLEKATFEPVSYTHLTLPTKA